MFQQSINIVPAIAMSLALVAGTAQAEPVGTRGENLGVGSGAAIGGLAAGPAGAIIGAAVGGLMGNRVERARLADHLEGELAQAESEASDLRAALDNALADLADRDTLIADLQRRTTTPDGLELEVLFRTGSSELDDESQHRLDSLVRVLDRNPELVISLDGYADPRGDSDSNQLLSEARTDAVRQTLIDRGIPLDRIASRGHGDAMSSAAEGDLDAYALERNVRIRLDDPAADTQVAHSD